MLHRLLTAALLLAPLLLEVVPPATEYAHGHRIVGTARLPIAGESK